VCAGASYFRRYTVRLFDDFSEDLAIFEEMELLESSKDEKGSITELYQRTSSPTLMVFPPQPGSRTQSPAFTFVGTTVPFLSGAPGPVAITFASGKGLLVADDGRRIPVAVF
jgi:hypothetical protein